MKLLEEKEHLEKRIDIKEDKHSKRFYQYNVNETLYRESANEILDLYKELGVICDLLGTPRAIIF